MSEQRVMISAEIPVELRDAIRDLGRKHERTFSAELRLALKRHLEAEATPVYRIATAAHDLNGRYIPRLDNIVPD